VRSPGIKAVLATMSLGAVLVACSASRDTPVANATAGQCDASRADHLIGENYSGYVERQALAESGATDIRVLKPDDAATMDFNPRRLNLHVDPGGHHQGRLRLKSSPASAKVVTQGTIRYRVGWLSWRQ
jgi:hypothetical protein